MFAKSRMFPLLNNARDGRSSQGLNQRRTAQINVYVGFQSGSIERSLHPAWLYRMSTAELFGDTLIVDDKDCANVPVVVMCTPNCKERNQICGSSAIACHLTPPSCLCYAF